MFIIIKIIAGSNKGFILKTKEGLSTRPTLNRIKENVFNIIREKVVNSNFLDLFAGSGGIALESISRGAARAVLVEKDKKAFAVVKANIDKTKTNDKVIAINSDYKDYLKRSNDKFDLIYIDPPYELEAYEECLNLIGNYKVLANEGIIIVESKKNQEIPLVNDYFLCYRNITYGNTKIWFYKEK